MAGNIWGEGPRGGLFGARIDPALLRELEKRAEAKRQMAQGLESAAAADTRPTFEKSLGGRILAAPSKLFGGLVVDPAVEGVTDLLTLAGDVYRGRQPTMSADPQTGEMHTDPRLTERTTNAAGTLTLGAGAYPAEANALRMGIKAYHGSPHSFERFDSSKIGTGEGAQAYGHGLYFAEREGVAGEYKKALAQTVTIDGKPLLQNNKMVGTTGRKSVDDELVAHNGDLEAAISNLEAHVSSLTPGQAARGAADDLAALKALRGRVSTANTGKMYEVDIAAEPEQFLDWDKPLSEQSPQVSEGLNQILKSRDRMPAEWIKSSPGAEQRLSEAGIPGIRYLDQGSRGLKDDFVLISPKQGQIDEWTVLNRQTGKHELFKDEAAARDYYEKSRSAKTRNYVIFPGNERLISILKKYGLPISAAGLAALTQLHPEEAKAAQRKDRK